MNDKTISELDAKLEQFAMRLKTQQDLLQMRGTLTSDESLKIAELDETTRHLRSSLRAKLADSHGVDWELLKLELQNDLLLLTNSFQNWSRRLDNRFDKST